LRAANGGDDLVGGGGDVVFGDELGGQGFTQRGDAGGGSVVGLVFDEGMDCRVLDRLGGFEVRLAAVEHVDFFAGGAEGHDLVADLHDVGEADFIESLGDTQATCFAGHGMAPLGLNES